MTTHVRRRRGSLRTGFRLACVLLAAMSTACCKAVVAQATGYVETASRAPSRAIREIDDRHTGARWLLLRDADRPGGPGRLTLAGSLRDEGGAKSNEKDAAAQGVGAVADARRVIHGGDRLVVEENTPVVAVRLEAVALGPAAAGDSLQARLAIGGKVMRVVALAPGRAEFEPQIRVRP